MLDSGAVTRLTRRDRQTAAIIGSLRRAGLWPPVVPSVVVVESVTGRPARDANTNRFLKMCDLVTEFPEDLVRRAAHLRFRAKRGSAVDALVIAIAEPAGRVLTGDPRDLQALAAHANQVVVESI